MRRLLLVLLLIVTLVTPFARPVPVDAAGQELYPDDDGTTFATFSANEHVTIVFGTILFACDFFYPTADVYVVQGTPTVGDTLTDVNGKQNTVFGAYRGLFSPRSRSPSRPVLSAMVGTPSSTTNARTATRRHRRRLHRCL